ncbi:MAG TPA: phosphoglucomutase/phosphomannomutase family protein [Thermoanaerobaculia bacterium]|nr:phosphoglucomutase/phosphomannomutase family protein [Thermoanaerobaculia bacterium]
MIQFGTSGWRAVLGEEFTFDNARRVVAAIARVARATGDVSRGILVASDTRFLNERFVDEAARVLVREGIKPLVADRDVPTPVVAFTIRKLGTLGGINFTASHNPPEYNGIKFSTADGAPALPAVTKEIEKEIAKTTDGDASPAPAAEYTRIDPRAPYLQALEGLVAKKTLKDAALRVAVDPRYGTSRGYLDEFLKSAGVDVAALHVHRDPYFGGLSPQCDAANLEELGKVVREGKRHLGLATDGDADRFGVLDPSGMYVNPNLCLMLLADHLLSKQTGTALGVARSVATTHGLDAVAGLHGVPVHTTPVGFKYIGELLLEGKIAMGGEESAGFTMVGHVPEKDGILADLLIAFIVAETGTPVPALIEKLFKRVGRFVPKRADAHLTPALAASLKKRLAEDPKELCGLKVESIDRMDGQKLLFEGRRWILFRPSGTEPVVRIYAESPDGRETDRLLNEAKKYVLE